MMMVSEGAEQGKAQLISRIVSSVAVQSDALQIQISKSASAPSFSAPEGRQQGRNHFAGAMPLCEAG
jgi:hypothetical protein